MLLIPATNSQISDNNNMVLSKVRSWNMSRDRDREHRDCEDNNNLLKRDIMRSASAGHLNNNNHISRCRCLIFMPFVIRSRSLMKGVPHCSRPCPETSLYTNLLLSCPHLNGRTVQGNGRETLTSITQ